MKNITNRIDNLINEVQVAVGKCKTCKKAIKMDKKELSKMRQIPTECKDCENERLKPKLDPRFNKNQDSEEAELALHMFPWLNKAKFKNALIDYNKEYNLLIWREGTWIDGTWEKGIWKWGIWEKGTWKSGEWENGTWENGTWENGTWENGTWEDGTWEDGTWKWGTWEKGTWKDGHWFGGTWIDGTWRGGYIKSFRSSLHP